MENIVSSYKAAEDDDEKMAILSNITETINLKTHKFLLQELDNKNLDEFVVIEILKVLSLYSPDSQQKKTIEIFFSLVKSHDDELVQSHALQELEHLPLEDKHYQLVLDLTQPDVDEDLQASAKMILVRAGRL